MYLKLAGVNKNRIITQYKNRAVYHKTGYLRKYLLKYAMGWLLIFIMLTGANAQSCHDQLKQLYAKNALGDLKSYLLDYSVSVDLGAAGPVRTERLKVISTAHKSMIISPNYKVYQDKEAMVSVLKDRQTIFIADNPGGVFRDKQMESWMQLQDSLVANAKEVQCMEEEVEGKIRVKMLVTFDEVTKQHYGLDKFVLWANADVSRMVRARVTYLKGSMKTLDLIVHAYDPAYTGETFQGNALQQVYNGRVLKTALRKYKVVNARKNISSDATSN